MAFDSTRLRQARVEKGLSMHMLAKKLNVRASAISRWENGHSLPSVTNMPKLARALSLRVSDLYTADQSLA